MLIVIIFKVHFGKIYDSRNSKTVIFIYNLIAKFSFFSFNSVEKKQIILKKYENPINK